MEISTSFHRPILTQCTLKNFNFQIDPYIGCEHYCYYCYALKEAETDWAREIQIYENVVEQLSRELIKIKPQSIYLGYKTDPYQPCEEKHQQTRKVLQLLLEKGFSASILTKSNLVTRDIDLLQKMKNSSISVSVAFNDDDTRKLFEGKTINTDDRIEALKKIKNAGIRTSALLCPVIPYITEPISLIKKLAPYTNTIWVYGLSILERTEQNWLNTEKILKQHYPKLKDQIESVIFSKDHSYWKELKHELLILQKENKLNLDVHI